MPKYKNDHDKLDEQKRQRAIYILEQVSLDQIRQASLATLKRWKDQGAWCCAHGEWEELMSFGSDEAVIKAMTSIDQNSTRLRQSPPYTAFHYLFSKR